MAKRLVSFEQSHLISKMNYFLMQPAKISYREETTSVENKWAAEFNILHKTLEQGIKCQTKSFA